MIELDPSSEVPPYEQVRSQLAAQIVDGALVVGARLPPVRRLAGELGLAVNTVARAYRELEEAGLVETRGRGGTVVAATGDAARATVRRAAERYAESAQALGIDAEEALRIVRSSLGLRPE